MKYGETLRQRSIPAWSAHNIDYDEIKHFIKDGTTHGKGKSISIPGRSDERLQQFQNALFHILEDQHSRISLFVASKAGEIRRRLDHAIKQLTRLSSQSATIAQEGAIPIERLERYSRLENDLLKAGDEIRSLARFASAQRTAFRKLLKKFKKWTGSAELESRFQHDVLDSPKSFTKLDLTPLLDDYSVALQSIRDLYESRLQRATSAASKSSLPGKKEQSPATQIHSTIQSRSRVDFDTAVATVPLGDDGLVANYFVHPDNVVELQVLLLRLSEYYRTRTPGTSTPGSSLSRKSSRTNIVEPDYFMLVADDLDRFAREQSALTIDEREHLAGQRPQKAKALMRWNPDEDAVLAVRSGLFEMNTVPVARKHVHNFFDASARVPASKDVRFAQDAVTMTSIRDGLLKDPKITPLYQISTCRSRFVGLAAGPQSVTSATLDTNIVLEKAREEMGEHSRSEFPFAVLQVRHEGPHASEMLSALEQSHLIERVRGFSLQYHALWQLYKPDNFAPPFWLPILSRDIRKLPPPAIRHDSSMAAGSSGSHSATNRSGSLADASTAVETGGNSSSAIPEDQFAIPPLRSFRKKRRSPTYPDATSDTRQLYWSEYDHPEDGDDSYVIYIDPNEKSSFDHFLDSIANCFRWQRSDEEDPLLPSTPDMAEISSDDEAGLWHAERGMSYGSIPATHRRSASHSHEFSSHPPFPRMAVVCFPASATILAVAGVLDTTAKQKYASEVDAAVLLSVVCSLAFAIVGFIPMLTWRRRGGGWAPFAVAIVVLAAIAVGSGGLLARLLG